MTSASEQWEWECSACTFINSHIDHQSACQLCLIERRRPWNDSSALNIAIEKSERTHSDDVVIEATSNHSLSNSYDLESSEPWPTELDAEISKCNDDASVEQGELKLDLSLLARQGQKVIKKVSCDWLILSPIGSFQSSIVDD